MADELNLPSRQQLADLPRWAGVAYAIRYAQRMRPLVRPENAKYADEAIALAIHAARKPESTSAQAIRGSLVTAADAVYDRPEGQNDASYDAAASAADAAANAIEGKAFEFRHALRLSVSFVLVAEASKRDYLALVALSARHKWTDDSPVDPAMLGPLWPDETPEWWSPRLDSTTARLEFRAPSHLSDGQIAERIARVVGLMDRLHRARGGTGLRLDDDIEAHDSVQVRQPQPTGGGR